MTINPQETVYIEASINLFPKVFDRLVHICCGRFLAWGEEFRGFYGQEVIRRRHFLQHFR